MSKKPTQSKIVNAALSLLGSTERITSIDDTKEIAKHAKAHWDLALQHIAGDHPWNFAIERAQLPEAQPAPAFGWTRAFELPNDCLRFLPPRDGDDTFYCCEVEDGRILTDSEAPLPVRYISSAKLDYTSKWPPYFAKAMQYELASRMAEAVTGSSSLQDKFGDAAWEAVKVAKRRDGLEGGRAKRAGATARGSWTRATRYGRRYGDDPSERGVV